MSLCHRKRLVLEARDRRVVECDADGAPKPVAGEGSDDGEHEALAAAGVDVDDYAGVHTDESLATELRDRRLDVMLYHRLEPLKRAKAESDCQCCDGELPNQAGYGFPPASLPLCVGHSWQCAAGYTHVSRVPVACDDDDDAGRADDADGARLLWYVPLHELTAREVVGDESGPRRVRGATAPRRFDSLHSMVAHYRTFMLLLTRDQMSELAGAEREHPNCVPMCSPWPGAKQSATDEHSASHKHTA